MRLAVITLFSAARLEHATNQFAAVSALAAATPPHGPEIIRHVAVWLDSSPPPPTLGGSPTTTDDSLLTLLHIPPGPNGMRLAAARNAGASAAIAAGAELLVFLDADCLPGEELFALYAVASAGHPDAALCGPVTYLPDGFDHTDPDSLRQATAPHPARPNPPAGFVEVDGSGDYRLFWSLSFALTPDAWRRSGAFDAVYEGYGAEDTDFGARLGEAGIPLAWVGGAHAYHQYHPTTSPPWQHLDDILRNGGLYAARWGAWPMEGWLAAFERAGAIAFDGSTWHRTGA